MSTESCLSVLFVVVATMSVAANGHPMETPSFTSNSHRVFNRPNRPGSSVLPIAPELISTIVPRPNRSPPTVTAGTISSIITTVGSSGSSFNNGINAFQGNGISSANNNNANNANVLNNNNRLLQSAVNSIRNNNNNGNNNRFLNNNNNNGLSHSVGSNINGNLFNSNSNSNNFQSNGAFANTGGVNNINGFSSLRQTNLGNNLNKAATVKSIDNNNNNGNSNGNRNTGNRNTGNSNAGNSNTGNNNTGNNNNNKVPMEAIASFLKQSGIVPPRRCTAGFSVRKGLVLPDQNTQKGRVFFQDVLTNAGGWQKDQQEFVAPCTGLYYFSYHAISTKDNDFTIALMKDGEYQVTAYGSKGGYRSGSNSALLYLETGQKVYLELQQGNIYEHPHEEAYTTFSGYLVNQ